MSTEQLDNIMIQVDALANDVATSDELEEISDVLLEMLLARIPLPWWLGWLRGRIRSALDAWLPEGLFQMIRDAAATVKARKRLAGGGGGSR